jgi:D-xylose transport system ATP-binding protein
MADNQGAPLLELRDISKRFGAVQALSNVTLSAYTGQVLALVGDNGAGKSTVVKTIAGINHADSGEILFAGRPVTITGPHDATALGIVTVYQDLALCDNLDVVANLYLGREDVEIEGGPLALLDEVAMEKRAVEVLRDLAVRIPSVRTPVASLSGGQRQSIAVARAVMWNSKLVMLDEPTAALGVAQTRQVLDLILRLKQQGLAVLVISHNLADVFEVADRVHVLYLGRSVATFDVRETTREQVVAAITGVGLRPSEEAAVTAAADQAAATISRPGSPS